MATRPPLLPEVMKADRECGYATVEESKSTTANSSGFVSTNADLALPEASTAVHAVEVLVPTATVHAVEV